MPNVIPSNTETEKLVGFWDEQKLATYLGISEKTIQRWRFIGQGPKYMKFGGRRCSAVRYKVQDVHDWLERQPSGGSAVA